MELCRQLLNDYHEVRAISKGRVTKLSLRCVLDLPCLDQRIRKSRGTSVVDKSVVT